MNKKEVPKRNLIRVVFAEAGKLPEVKMVSSSLKSFQLLVGGMIERIDFHHSIPESNLYLNEEGIGMQLPLNRLWDGHFLLGDIFISKSDNEEGDEVGLSEEEAQKVIALLAKHSIFPNTHGRQRRLNEIP